MLKLDPVTGSRSRIIRPRNQSFNRDAFGDAAFRAHFKANNGGAGAGAAYTQGMNDQAQAAVLAMAQPMIQQVGGAVTYNASNTAQGQQFNVVLNNVGLNTKLTIEVTGTIAQAAAETLNKTQFGLANFFSNIQLTDMSNYQRVNTSGMHLSVLATLRRQWAFGAAFVNDSPVNLGSNFAVNSQPTGVTVAQSFRMFFEVPIAYSDFDLRGAIYAAVYNATWRLSCTVNASVIVGSAADATNACWQSTTAGDVGSLTNVSIIVYQHYLDQLPRDQNNNPVVPLLSLAYNYLIQRTQPSGLVVTQDFPVQYANFRQFLSTIILFNNGGTLSAGTDVNYLGIQVANLTFLEKLDPFMASLKTRNIIGDDWPPGMYAFDHRRKPIDVNQYGNMQFVLNASTVNAGAYLDMMYEMLAVQSQAINAGSLAAQ